MARFDASDPLDLLRLVAGVLLVLGTGIALVVWLVLDEPRMLELAAALWALYGIGRAVVNGFLTRAADLPGLIAGTTRPGTPQDEREVSEVTDTTAARARSARFLTPALPAPEVESTVQGAMAPGTPAADGVRVLQQLRRTTRLSEMDDIRVGLALLRLHEERLNDPAGALAELRRLIARHDDPVALGQLRAALADVAPQLLPAFPAENEAR